MDKRIFKRSQIDSNKSGWVADISTGDVVNPDFYYFFELKKHAQRFINLVDSGETARTALFMIEREMSV